MVVSDVGGKMAATLGRGVDRAHLLLGDESPVRVACGGGRAALSEYRGVFLVCHIPARRNKVTVVSLMASAAREVVRFLGMPYIVMMVVESG